MLWRLWRSWGREEWNLAAQSSKILTCVPFCGQLHVKNSLGEAVSRQQQRLRYLGIRERCSRVTSALCRDQECDAGAVPWPSWGCGECSKAPSLAPEQGSCSELGAAAIPCPFPVQKRALLHKCHSELCLRGVFWEGKERVGLTYILHIMSRKPERRNGRNVHSFSPPLILSDRRVTSNRNCWKYRGEERENCPVAPWLISCRDSVVLKPHK